jgi:hypothetical protein
MHDMIGVARDMPKEANHSQIAEVIVIIIPHSPFGAVLKMQRRPSVRIIGKSEMFLKAEMHGPDLESVMVSS